MTVWEYTRRRLPDHALVLLVLHLDLAADLGLLRHLPQRRPVWLGQGALDDLRDRAALPRRFRLPDRPRQQDGEHASRTPRRESRCARTSRAWPAQAPAPPQRSSAWRIPARGTISEEEFQQAKAKLLASPGRRQEHKSEAGDTTCRRVPKASSPLGEGRLAPDPDLVEYVVITVPDLSSSLAVAQALRSLVESSRIRILDLVAVVTDAHGGYAVTEPELVAALGDLGGVDGEVGGLLSDDDIALACRALPSGSSALILVAEDRWAQEWRKQRGPVAAASSEASGSRGSGWSRRTVPAGSGWARGRRREASRRVTARPHRSAPSLPSARRRGRTCGRRRPAPAGGRGASAAPAR